MKQLSFLLFISLFFFLSSCAVEITDPLETVFSGITETGKYDPTSTGAVDPDDWQMQEIAAAPSSEGRRSIPLSYNFDPAFPNPADSLITFQFGLGSRCSVKVFVCEKPGRIIATIFDAPHSAGYHQINYNIKGLKRGIYRACFSATAEDGTKYISYGDFIRK